MATVAVPGGGTRRISARVLSATRTTAAKAAKIALTPHKAALANLRDMPLTVAGVAGIDFAGWHISHGWGWLITGVSMIIVEHLIADEA